MRKPLAALTGLILASAVASTAIGQSDENAALLGAVKARQAQMDLYAFNIGLLGGMAKGAVPYDAEAATKAAANLAALATMDSSRMWPEGSDNFALGDDATAALPAIWEEGSTIGDKAFALAEAATAMEAAAGEGLDSLKGAMGALGGACGACHKAYRQPK